jgi:hypothetical protein
MFRNIQKFTFFFLYFRQILGNYIYGLLLTNSLIILSISRLNLISIITFIKFNLIAGFSSLLDIIVVDNINLIIIDLRLLIYFGIYIMVTDLV